MQKIFFTFLLICNLGVFAQSWSEVGRDGDTLNDETIKAICTDNKGNVYTIGNNSQDVHYVVKWDGINWSELGKGKNVLSRDRYLESIATDTVGNVYVIGSFKHPHKSGHFLVKWDGEEWSDINKPEGIIKLTIDNTGNLYAIGYKYKANEHYIAKWNGGRWLNIVAEKYVLGNSVNELNINFAGLIYAVINKSTTNEKSLSVCKWNGTEWLELGGDSFSLNANKHVRSIVFDKEGYLYVTGEFTNANGSYNISKWDGIKWSVYGNNITMYSDRIYDLYNDQVGNLFTVLHKYPISYHSYNECIAQWNDTGWVELLNGRNKKMELAHIHSMCTDAEGNIYASFQNDSYESTQHIFIAKWDVLGNTMNALIGSAVLSVDRADNLYMAGDVFNLAKWNGKKWVEVGEDSSKHGYSISSLCNDALGNIYVAGHYPFYYPKPFIKPYLANWDGNAWTEMSTYNDTLVREKSIIQVCAGRKGFIYALMHLYKDNKNFIAKWDGSKWSEMDGYNKQVQNSYLPSISTDKDGNLYVLYNIHTNNFRYTDQVVKWDGKAWTEFAIERDTILDHIATTIFVDAKGILYAGHNIKNSNNLRYVAKWDGNQWVEIGSESNHYGGRYSHIRSICTDSKGTIYVGGSLSEVNRKFPVVKYSK